MAFDFRKLKGKIVEVFETQANFAKAMGWSERTTSKKLSGKIPWTQRDICNAITVLGLGEKDIQDYFFTRKVQNI